MLPESHISFLKDKVQELQSALFFSMSNSVLKMPNTIVNALEVDDVGQVWFLINRPSQQLQEFDREFPARLDFFKKGKNFYLKITGKACIVSDPEELNGLENVLNDVKAKITGHMVLVKVRIVHADYYENAAENEISWFQNLKYAVKKWLFNIQPGYRPYSIQPDTLVSY